MNAKDIKAIARQRSEAWPHKGQAPCRDLSLAERKAIAPDDIDELLQSLTHSDPNVRALAQDTLKHRNADIVLAPPLKGDWSNRGVGSEYAVFHEKKARDTLGEKYRGWQSSNTHGPRGKNTEPPPRKPARARTQDWHITKTADHGFALHGKDGSRVHFGQGKANEFRAMACAATLNGDFELARFAWELEVSDD